MAADIVVSAAIETSQARNGAAQFNAALASMRNGVQGTKRALGELGQSVFSLRNALVGLGGAWGVQQVLEAGDAYQQLKARLALLVGESESVVGVMEGLNQAAMRARAPVGDLTARYVRHAAALENMGRSAAEGIRLAETLHKVVVISGAGAQQASAGLGQLAQVFDSGRFQGEEFKSVAENIPEILRIMERQTGKTRGELRKLGAEGKLTAEDALNALANSAAEVDEKFAKMPETAGQAWARLSDTFAMQTGKAVESQGAIRAWTEAMDEATKTSLSGNSAFTLLGDAIKLVGDGFGYSARQARVMAEETRLAELQAQKSQSTLSRHWQEFKANVAQLFDGAAWLGRGAITGNFDESIRKQAEALADMKGTFTPESDAVVEAAATGGPKREIKLDGGGADDATAKKAEKLRADLRKAYEEEKLRNAVTLAEVEGNGALAQQLRTQLEIRSKISDELRKSDPAKAAALEREIELAGQLEIQLDNIRERQERNTAFARDFAGTITSGFSAAIQGGQGLSATLKDVGLKMVDVVTQAALLKPLENNIAGLISGGLNGSGGFDIGSLFSGGATTTGWTPTVTMFAKGGVLNSPANFTSGGMRGRAGEAGEEGLLPLRRGPDGKLGVSSYGGGKSGDMNITVNIAGDASDATVTRLIGEMETVVARMAPGLTRQAVAAVRRENVRDRNYMRR